MTRPMENIQLTVNMDTLSLSVEQSDSESVLFADVYWNVPPNKLFILNQDIKLDLWAKSGMRKLRELKMKLWEGNLLKVAV